MRARDFVKEASIFTKPERYQFGHKVKVGTSANGKKLLDAILKKIPDFDQSEELTWIPASDTLDSVPPLVTFGLGGEVKYFRRPNNKIFGIDGTAKIIQTALTHAPGQKGSTAKNVGDISEPILSAAVVAKLIKRSGDFVEDITEEDVKQVLNSALSNPQVKFQVQDKNSKVADIIEFSLAIRGPSMDFLKSEEFWTTYKLLPSAIHYANSGQIDRYADYFYKNGKVDMIKIVSDGMSEQKTRKTDITAFANGKPLKHLSISLKAGSPHIGQVGGGQITNPYSKTGVVTNAEKLFSPLGIAVPRAEGYKNKLDYWKSVYKTANTQLNNSLSGQDAKKEAGIIYQIADYIKSHGAGSDSTVKLVSLTPDGLSSIHSFKNLEKKLVDQNINLAAKYREGKSQTGEVRPEITILDQNSNVPLIKIRFSSTQAGDKVWNTIEMGKLAKQLTTLQFNKSKPVTPEPAAPVQQPVQQQPQV